MSKPPTDNGFSGDASPERGDGAEPHEVAAAATALPRATRRRHWVLLGIGLLGVLVLVYPGDIPWHNDEPWLIQNALDHNELGRPATLGLRGSVGVRYGPVPTWIYQSLLMLTHDPIVLGFIKTAVSLGILIVVVWRLAVILRLPRVFILFVCASPFVHHYIRILWDNSFNILFSPLYLLAAIETLRRRSLAWMALTVGIAWLMIHSHLNNALVILPVFSVLLWAGRRTWLRRWPAVLTILLIGTAATIPYARYAITELALSDGFKSTYTDALTGWLSGARYFSAVGWRPAFFSDLIGPAAIVPPILIEALELTTWLVFGFCLLGLAGTARHWLHLRRHRRRWTLADWYALTSLSVILTVGVYFIGSRQEFAPHYLVGSWLCYGYFVWRGMATALRSWPRPGALLIGLHLTALIAFLAIAKGTIHTNGGNRGGYNGLLRPDNYGATLANQLDVARTIRQYHPDSELILQVDNYIYFADDLPVLLRLLPPPADPASLPRRPLLIRYRDLTSAHTGHITVEVLDE